MSKKLNKKNWIRKCLHCILLSSFSSGSPVFGTRDTNQQENALVSYTGKIILSSPRARCGEIPEEEEDDLKKEAQRGGGSLSLSLSLILVFSYRYCIYIPMLSFSFENSSSDPLFFPISNSPSAPSTNLPHSHSLYLFTVLWSSLVLGPFPYVCVCVCVLNEKERETVQQRYK